MKKIIFVVTYSAYINEDQNISPAQIADAAEEKLKDMDADYLIVSPIDLQCEDDEIEFNLNGVSCGENVTIAIG